MVGRYALTLSTGTACEAFPEIVQGRIYTADIVENGDTAYPYMVKLYDASFVRGCWDPRFPPRDNLPCNEFVAWRSDDSIVFNFLAQTDDAQNWEYNKIVEVLTDGTWIELSGDATGRMNAGSITAEGKLSLSHWLVFGGPGSRYSTCRSNDLRMQFSRR